MALSLGAFAFHAQADTLAVFGDSLSDPGNFHIVVSEVLTTPPYQLADQIPDYPYNISGYHFSNGPTWIEQMEPSISGPAFAPRPGNNSNYAIGRARARVGGGGGFTAYTLTDEVAQFLGDRGCGATQKKCLGKNTDAIIWAGALDIKDELFGEVNAINGALNAIADNVSQLKSAGARRVFIINIPNLGLTPFLRSLGQPYIDYASNATEAFNGALQSLGADKVIDVAGKVNALFSEGRLISDKSCIDYSVGVACDKPNGYLFWDAIHPTKAGHAEIATFVKNALK